jgi:sigma-B regulation protein RsbU (phosphoserine phosphatase)
MTNPVQPAENKSLLQKIQLKTRLSVYISIILAIALTLSLVGFGYISLKILRENKVRDIVMILHYDADYLTRQLAQEFKKLDDSMLHNVGSNLNYKLLLYDEKIKKFKNIRGFTKPWYSQTDIAIPPEGPPLAIHIVSINGALYLAKRVSDLPWLSKKEDLRAIALFDFNFGVLKNGFKLVKNSSLVYLVSHFGQLLYSNSPEITELTLASRPLAKKFAELSLESMQMEYHDLKAGDTYGFFSSIEGTNLVLFSETTKKVITEQIHKVKNTFIYYGLAIILVAIILLNLGMSSVYLTLRRLLDLTQKISSGNFHLQIKPSSFGELNRLSVAFLNMSKSLLSRDEKIQKLIQQERENAQLQLELGVSREIQNNFLPNILDNMPSRLVAASYYMPSNYVAGDWYGVDHDVGSHKSYFIVADVSGHGAGASMYTAMIAALFEYARSDHFKAMTIPIFMEHINRLFLKIGKAQWHVSMLGVEIDFDQKKVIFYNAGHLPPVIYKSGADGMKATFLPLASSLLGLEDTIKIKIKEIPLEKNCGFLLYTDGIIEAQNSEHVAYSKKRLRKVIEDKRNSDPKRLIELLQQSLMSFLQTAKAGDDVCLLCFKFLG